MDDMFKLVTDSGYSRESTIMDTEDVSYVSSPYLPTCVRNPRNSTPFTSNADRAHESAAGTSSNIKDELDITIVLKEVRATTVSMQSRFETEIVLQIQIR